MKLTPEEFYKIWQSAKTKEEVRQLTSLTDVAINGRVRRLRKAGFDLRKFIRGRKPLTMANIGESNVQP